MAGQMRAIERNRQGPGPFSRDAVPLAWRNLMGDRKRIFRSGAGIGFAVLLMFMQLGFRNAFIDSVLELPRLLDGEAFLISPQKYRIGWIDPFPRRRLHQAKSFPGVEWVRPVYMEEDRSIWKNPEDGTSHAIRVVAVDPDQPVFRVGELNAKLAALKAPNTVIMDRRSRHFFGTAREGIRTELARRDVRVVGAFPIGPDFVTDGTLIMSDRNFLKFFAAPGPSPPRLDRVEIGVIKVASGTDIAALVATMRRSLPDDVSILTRDELIALQRRFHEEVSSVGPIFVLGAAIGFVVGMLISYQIMYTDLSDQLPQYATLKAIGYDNRYLAGIVLQQAVFFGIVGYVPALALSILLYGVIGELVLLPMNVSLGLALAVMGLTIVMCVLPGAIAAMPRIIAW